MLAEHYRSLMRTHDCDDLVQLIKTIYGKNRERTAQGKKPARTEAEYMKRAEELLHGVLGNELSLLLSGVCVLRFEDRHLLLDLLLNFGGADDVDLALVDELSQLECALRLDVVVRLGVNC